MNKLPKVLLASVLSTAIVLLGLFCSENVQAQDSPDRIVLCGLNFNTRGGLLAGASVRVSQRATERRFHTFLVDWVGIKDPKEVRTTGSVTKEAFVPGKTNHFFCLRGQYGQEYLFFEPREERGVRLSGSAAVGLSAGFILPYVIKYDIGSNPYLVQAYDPRLHPNFQNIQGAISPFSASSDMQTTVGANLKLALTAVLNLNDSNCLGIEAGYNADVFARKIPIMAFTSARSSMGVLYLTLSYGIAK